MAPKNNMANPELCKMLENLQRHDQPQGNMEWRHSDRELDQMPDMDEDGKNLTVEGQTIIRDGKYGKSKQALAVEEIYIQDKNYVNWIRQHIQTTSSIEMQRLKVYVVTRDQAKRERLERHLGNRPGMNVMHTAKAKANPMSRVRARETDEVENMEWRYVMTQGVGKELLIMESVDGMPVRMVNPAQSAVTEEEKNMIEEMKETLELFHPTTTSPVRHG